MDKTEDDLILENMPLVHYIINRYYPTFTCDEDVIQSGRLGLISASKVYDPTKGTFSNFASKCILNEICKEFRRRKHQNETLSLDYITEDDEGEATPLVEMLSADTDVAYFDKETMFRRLSKTERTVAELLLKGFTRTEVSKMLGVSRQRVGECCRRIQLKWKKWYI